MIALKMTLPHYTYEDYLQWEGRWELIGGIPFAMSPAPAMRHQQIAATLGALFYNALQLCDSRCVVYQPVDYKIEEDTILQPDMLVVCGETKKKFLDFPPELVAEILSPSTAYKDRHTKFPIYESEGIPYYLILSPERNDIEIYELDRSEYTLRQKGNSVQFGFRFSGCAVSVDFREIWQPY